MPTWTLLDNPVTRLYGPNFLLVYAALIGVALYFAWRARRDALRGENGLGFAPPPPVPTDPDPMEIAWLRGGRNEAARLAMFNLHRKGYLEVDEKTGRLAPKPGWPDKPEASLDKCEHLVLKWFGEAARPGETLANRTAAEELDEELEPMRSRLERAGLAIGEEDYRRIVGARTGAIFMIAGIGAMKLAAALLNGYRNVWFLIPMLIAGTIAAAVVARPTRLTERGRRYLRSLQVAFRGLKSQARGEFAEGRPASSGASSGFGLAPSLATGLAFAVFGPTILANTGYEAFGKTIQPVGAGTGGADGGYYGSSCSSGGGGDGGGGGGCGGCGGCG